MSAEGHSNAFVVSSKVALKCCKTCAINCEAEIKNKCVEVRVRTIGHVYLGPAKTGSAASSKKDIREGPSYPYTPLI